MARPTQPKPTVLVRVDDLERLLAVHGFWRDLVDGPAPRRHPRLHLDRAVRRVAAAIERATSRGGAA